MLAIKAQREKHTFSDCENLVFAQIREWCKNEMSILMFLPSMSIVRNTEHQEAEEIKFTSRPLWSLSDNICTLCQRQFKCFWSKLTN